MKENLGSLASDQMTTLGLFLSLLMSSLISVMWFFKRPFPKPSKATPDNA
jgi:hypothetical protein